MPQWATPPLQFYKATTGATTEMPVASGYAHEKAPADRFGNCTEP
jgi:hypothetical protein